MSDTTILGRTANRVLQNNPEFVDRYQSEDDKVVDEVVTQVIHQTGGVASDTLVREKVLEILEQEE